MNRHDFDILVLNLLENGLSDTEIKQLQDILFSKPEYLQRYCEFVKNYTAVQMKLGSGVEFDRERAMDLKSFNTPLWQALAEQERSAEPVKIVPNTAASPELIRDVRERKLQLRTSRPISHLRLYTALAGWAALFLVIVYVMMNPRPMTQPTGTIVESISASWGNAEFEGKIGTRLYNTDSSRRLIQGLVKVRLEDGAEVLIQGPAEFCAENTNQLYLAFGKISTVIPPRAQGFVVRTPSATVVDYGTEFGIIVDPAGRTEAHVFKGEVELRCGPDPVRHGGAQRLLKGLAGTVTAARELEGMPYKAQEAMFIRDMSAVKDSLFNGRQLNLADIVGGGNGFGSGKLDVGIDPVTGKMVNHPDEIKILNRQSEHRFMRASELLFVDSVFVPGFDAEPTQVSSTGLTTDVFGTTSGSIWGYLFNGAWHEGVGGVFRHPLMLDGAEPERSTGAALTIHSNLGITFDMDTIRRALPGLEPRRLRARAGVSETVRQFAQENPGVVFWVLVDGQVRLSRPIRMSEGGFDIDVTIGPDKRFVSLAVTEEGGSNGFNWSVFLNPRLELEIAK
jgi:hypothetical protein